MPDILKIFGRLTATSARIRTPPASSVYRYEDGQICLEEDATKRCGVQPIVELTAKTHDTAAIQNGSDCVKVKAGEEVTFTAKAIVPQGVGFVTAMDFGFEDKREVPVENCFPVSGQLTHEDFHGQDMATATVTHTFTRPGTYFTAVRVKAERNGNKESIFTQEKNLARARVIVE